MAKTNQTWLEMSAARIQSRAPIPAPLASAISILRDAVSGFTGNNDLLRASALTYTVALSVVPMLALAFSAMKGLGGADQMRPLIAKYLAGGSDATANQIMGFIQNVNGAALGTAGGAALLFTVIGTMGTIEQALNTIFHVPQSRSYLRKFSDYLSVLFTVPILIVSALGFTAALSVKSEYASFLGSAAPYLLAWAGFWFLYVFFPYTKVRWSAAAIGSFAAALMFQIAQWGYVKFQVGMAGYHAIYGALASVPIFLVWTYFAWAIVLFGAELTASVQRGAGEPFLSPESPEFACAAALEILVRLVDRFRGIGVVADARSFARELRAPSSAIERVVAALKDAGAVVESAASAGEHGGGLFLARDPETIVLGRVLESVEPDGAVVAGDSRVAKVIGAMARARIGVVDSMTLAQLYAGRAESPASQS